MTYSSECAPIILFVHARPDQTMRTIESLQRNAEASISDLYIFSDGPKPSERERQKVAETRNLVKSICGFRSISIFEAERNMGLAHSIISGVSHVFGEHERAIILEDDLILSSGFLRYMNQALTKYSESTRVLSISGHSFPIRFPREYPWDVAFGVRASSWGWATWKNRWEKIDWRLSDYHKFRRSLLQRLRFNRGGSDMSAMLNRQQAGRTDSWAIRFCYHQFRHSLVDIFPRRSLVENAGFNEDGTNCRHNVNSWKVDFWGSPPDSFNFPDQPFLDDAIMHQFRSFNSITQRALRVVRRKFTFLRA